MIKDINKGFKNLFESLSKKDVLKEYINSDEIKEKRFVFSRRDEYGYPIPAEDFGLSEEVLEDLVGEAGSIKGVAVEGDSFEDGYYDVEFDNGFELGAVSGIHLLLVDNIEECLSKLNEEAISPEDKKDSDLIRSVLNKVKNRVNARLTPEEQAVLDKYGIKRTYRKFDTGNLSVNGRDLDRYVDNQSAKRFYSKSYNNGNPSEINYADRARKYSTTRDKNSQIFTSPWSADNDQINAHGYNNMMHIKGLQDAERYEQEMPEIDRIETMKRALSDRNYHSGEIAKADSRRDAAIGKAKAEFDKAVSKADRDYEYDTVTRKGYVDRAQKEIDTLLKRESLDEAVSKEAIDTVDIAVDNVVDNFISDISNLAQQIQPLNKGYTADLAAEDGNHPTSIEVDKALDNLRKALKANLLANSSINEACDESFGIIKPNISMPGIPGLTESTDVREYTNKLLDLVDEGVLDGKDLALAALKWMSEDDVREMAKANEFVDFFAPDDEDDLNEFLDIKPSINLDARGFGGKDNNVSVLGGRLPLNGNNKLGEDLGSDVNKFQEWVDYDMKRYGRISKQTKKEVEEAGLKIVKDKYGDYEVIA